MAPRGGKHGGRSSAWSGSDGEHGGAAAMCWTCTAEGCGRKDNHGWRWWCRSCGQERPEKDARRSCSADRQTQPPKRPGADAIAKLEGEIALLETMDDGEALAGARRTKLEELRKEHAVEKKPHVLLTEITNKLDKATRGKDKTRRRLEDLERQQKEAREQLASYEAACDELETKRRQLLTVAAVGAAQNGAFGHALAQGQTVLKAMVDLAGDGTCKEELQKMLVLLGQLAQPAEEPGKRSAHPPAEQPEAKRRATAAGAAGAEGEAVDAEAVAAASGGTEAMGQSEEPLQARFVRELVEAGLTEEKARDIAAVQAAAASQQPPPME